MTNGERGTNRITLLPTNDFPPGEEYGRIYGVRESTGQKCQRKEE
jgi:hypothetical protein